ncbi:MAG TPA: transposase [Planctomycetaceae bacterium]|nr:transposase [Planctomycetaceae bacterium]
MVHRETITRRNLPHWFVPHAAHFVTYRLAGTIPLKVIHRLRDERTRAIAAIPDKSPGAFARREIAHKRFFAAYDRYLDQNTRIDWFRRPEVAKIVRDNLYHHDGGKYRLLAYCVMPNHVHVLFLPLDDAGQPIERAAPGDLLAPLDSVIVSDEAGDAPSPLSGIMHSLKGYTAKECNRLLDRRGQFWQPESYDHWCRDEAEIERIVEYIHWNPVRARLCREPVEWTFSSAHDGLVKTWAV